MTTPFHKWDRGNYRPRSKMAFKDLLANSNQKWYEASLRFSKMKLTVTMVKIRCEDFLKSQKPRVQIQPNTRSKASIRKRKIPVCLTEGPSFFKGK